MTPEQALRRIAHFAQRHAAADPYPSTKDTALWDHVASLAEDGLQAPREALPPPPKKGRPRVSGQVEDAIRARLRAGWGMASIARTLRVGSSTVQRVKAEMSAGASEGE